MVFLLFFSEIFFTKAEREIRPFCMENIYNINYFSYYSGF